MTYDQLYRALDAKRRVKYPCKGPEFSIVKLVPTGTERWDPRTGALVQLAAPDVPAFWERGAVLVPVGPRR